MTDKDNLPLTSKLNTRRVKVTSKETGAVYEFDATDREIAIILDGGDVKRKLYIVPSDKYQED